MRDPLDARGPGWRTRLRGHSPGRRGAFLLFLAVLDFCYGYALLTASIAALRASPDLILPVHAWGWIWAGMGAVCLSGALARRDWPQFVLAATLKAAWAAVYADIWLVQGGGSEWVSVVVWASFSMVILVVASWPEPGTT